jgi:predicted MFS family arabinose efflux permease
VLFINPPICAIVIVVAFRLVSGGAPRRLRQARFDLAGALLGTSGMLLLIYALVNAPSRGWGSTTTIGELAGAGVLLTALVVNELRHPDPILPLSIFRIKGLAAADVTQVLAVAGFYSTFFFVTLYMQEVLHFSALRAGAAYVPVAAIVAVGAAGGSGLISRIGTRPLIVAGSVIAAGGIFWVSRIPAHGYYWTGIFPAMMVMGIGLGAVFVGVQTAANAGVPADKAGLAGALINASFQVGGALGLAIFSALATARTRELLAAHAPAPAALAGGYARALLASAIFVAVAAVIGLRTANTKGEPAAEVTAMAIDDAAAGAGRSPAGREEETTPSG